LSTVPPDFDFREPDYVAVFRRRIDFLNRIRANPSNLPALKAFYRDNPAQFITDWGCTADPRNVEIGRPVIVPFILFPRQEQWIAWVIDSWRQRRPGVTPKSRESGVSWVAIALSCTLCLFYEGMAIGFGSRKEEYVDKIGAPKSLFWKARKFIDLLPPEFKNGFDSKNDAPHMRIQFKRTDSIMTGEAGDNIGRGDRASIYFVDESAFLEHPETVEAALSQTTNCRIDVSTANGLGNPFHRKVTEWPADRVFRFHWRDDPRKDDAWYAKQVEELDPVTIAQELDIDFSASVEGVLIPSAWVQAAIDAHVKLGFKPTGAKSGSLDVADEGKDLNAFCGAHGPVIEVVEEWSGKGDDIFGTVQRAFGICDERGYDRFKYDADGLGAGVRGDARVINEGRTRKLRVDAFRGSAAPFNPDGEDVKGRKNQDFFANCKAQSWWSLRVRFQKTFRAVKEGATFSPDELISISSGAQNRQKLCAELSQPTYSVNAVGKIVIDKAPDGNRSPNLADAVMIQFSSVTIPAILFSKELLRRI
jgi:hypothetical protein